MGSRQFCRALLRSASTPRHARLSSAASTTQASSLLMTPRTRQPPEASPCAPLLKGKALRRPLQGPYKARPCRLILSPPSSQLVEGGHTLAAPKRRPGYPSFPLALSLRGQRCGSPLRLFRLCRANLASTLAEHGIFGASGVGMVRRHRRLRGGGRAAILRGGNSRSAEYREL